MKFRNSEINEKDKPTKEQFQTYVEIQMSGITNMFDVNCVIILSERTLSPENIFYIWKHYEELSEEYNIHYCNVEV